MKNLAVLSILLLGGSGLAREPVWPPLPVGVSSLGAAVADGYLYVYGGHSGKTHSYSTQTVVGTFRRLKLSGGKNWEELPGGPGMQGLALVAHKGKLYRVGGMQPRNKPGDPADNHSLAQCACYDPATRKWQALPDLPAGRSSHDAVVLGDRLYVIGGWKLSGVGSKPQWHDTAVVLDLSAEKPKWESLQQPFRRRALTVAAFQGKIYAIAGLTDTGETSLAVDIYDPEKKAWSNGPCIPKPARNGFTPAACVVNGRLYLSPSDGKLWRLDDRASTWQDIGTFQQRRAVHRLVPAGDGLLLAVGGSSGGENVAALEAVTTAKQ